MKRIGHTATGTLVEITAADVVTIQAALAVLGEIGGTAPACDLPPPPAPERRPVSPVKAVVSGADKPCKVCNMTKPRDQFPKAGGRVCKECTNKAARKKYEPATKRAKVAKAKGQSADHRFAPKDHKLSGRVTRETAAGPREHDERLDRPQNNGRTLPVGAQE